MVFMARNPYTYQRVYRRKSDSELENHGEYSWIADAGAALPSR